MAFEIECGSCGHRLSVEGDAVVAVCPSCGTSLEVPSAIHREAAGASADREEATVEESAPADVSERDVAAAAESAESAAETDVKDESLSAFPGLPDAPSGIDGDMSTMLDTGDPAVELPSSVAILDPHASQTEIESDEEPTTRIMFPVAAGEAALETEPVAVGMPSEQAAGESLEEAAPWGDDAPREETEASSPAGDVEQEAGPLIAPTTVPPRSRGVPSVLFIMLAGYASAVTIALLWFWFRYRSQLNLPDVQPKTGYIVPEETPMPWGHTLRLGQTRRFGNLEVTPERVSRGPLAFYNRELDETETGQTPTLKLWLKIRNVSDDQSVTPFGRRLLLMRSSDGRANTFVCRASEKSRDGVRLLPYPLDVDDAGLMLKDQQPDRELKPGEEYKTYIATDTDAELDSLKGELLWRVHFRKGYNRDSGNGVTTLIEVAFHSAEIEEE